MFEGTGIFEFVNRFKTEEYRKDYLYEIKWGQEFACRKCGGRSWSKTKDNYTKKCNRCKHKESVTAGKLFHKCKFPLRKALIDCLSYERREKASIVLCVKPTVGTEKIDLLAVSEYDSPEDEYPGRTDGEESGSCG